MALKRVLLATLLVVLWCDSCMSRSSLTTSYCDKEAYNPSIETCCRESDWWYLIPTTMECCREGEDGMTDPNSHICCDGNPHPGEFPETACCGTLSINETQDCCDPGKSLLANKTKQKCCAGKVIEIGTGCCNNKWKMAPDEVCCPQYGPKKATEPGQDACCENRMDEKDFTLFNSTTHECDSTRKVVERTTIDDKSHITDATSIQALDLSRSPKVICRFNLIIVGKLVEDPRTGGTLLIRSRKPIIQRTGRKTVPAKMIIPLKADTCTSFLSEPHIFFINRRSLRVAEDTKYNRSQVRKLRKECKDSKRRRLRKHN